MSNDDFKYRIDIGSNEMAIVREALEEIFPFWKELLPEEKEMVKENARVETYGKGVVINRTTEECKGLMAVRAGQLRTYILSEEGREVTLFRVQEGEICVLSASCLMDSIIFDVLIEAMEPTEVIIIPSSVLHQIKDKNPYVELYLYKTATEKFSDVMWTMQQILFLRIDQRVAAFLWDEMQRQKSMTITVTHDEIARYIGSAREVVTKVLKYLAQEKVVELKRGKIEIVNKEKLKRLL